jgi:hypothetical protein
MIKSIKEFLKFRKREKVHNSPEPFFVMNIIRDDAEGTEVEMDWNAAFIKSLRDKGYIGISDEQVIEGYLFRIFERAHMRNLVRENLSKSDVDD